MTIHFKKCHRVWIHYNSLEKSVRLSYIKKIKHDRNRMWRVDALFRKHNRTSMSLYDKEWTFKPKISNSKITRRDLKNKSIGDYLHKEHTTSSIERFKSNSSQRNEFIRKTVHNKGKKYIINHFSWLIL